MPPASPPLYPPVPPAPAPDATGCDEFKRRWDLSIGWARDDYDNNPSYPYGNFQLHNHAFSRQCWQYSHASGPSGITDAKNLCENRIQQSGYTSYWWTYTWNDANSGSYNFASGTGSNAETIDTQTSTNAGWYTLCMFDGTICKPANTFGNDYWVFLEPTHPSYFPPNMDATPAQLTPLTSSPAIPEAAICPATGFYSPVLTYPLSGNIPSDSENRMIETPGVSITPVSPPSPLTPPTPPHVPPPPRAPPFSPPPPSPPSYDLVSVLNDPVANFISCVQTRGANSYREDVETAEECAHALENVGLSSASDPIMQGAYNDGYRCHVNASSVFVWKVPPLPSPSRFYVCRAGGPPVGRRRLSTAQRISYGYLSSWVDAHGYFYSAQLHRSNTSYEQFVPAVQVYGSSEFTKTDVGYMRHKTCGLICVIDDRITSEMYRDGQPCTHLSKALLFFLDDDRC
jgi:hypothetical protein